MHSLLEHFEVSPDQAKLFPVESESMKFKSLDQCVQVGRAYFNEDQHKVVRSYMGVYRALIGRKVKRYLLGVSTRRAVYVRLVK
jgi:hypothetical protein